MVAIDLKPAELVIDCRCVVGESILWCPRREALWWTDNPETQQTRTRDLPDRFRYLAQFESGKLLQDLAKGLVLAETDWTSDRSPRLSALTIVKKGRVESLFSAMTDELVELLRKHSLLGRLIHSALLR